MASNNSKIENKTSLTVYAPNGQTVFKYDDKVSISQNAGIFRQNRTRENFEMKAKQQLEEIDKGRKMVEAVWRNAGNQRAIADNPRQQALK